MCRSLPLTEETQEKVEEDIRELDGALAIYILNLTEDERAIMQWLPDVLTGLGLSWSHTALLYALGYEDSLRADGVVPPEETMGAVPETEVTVPLAAETQPRLPDPSVFNKLSKIP